MTNLVIYELITIWHRYVSNKKFCVSCNNNNNNNNNFRYSGAVTFDNAYLNMALVSFSRRDTRLMIDL